MEGYNPVLQIVFNFVFGMVAARLYLDGDKGDRSIAVIAFALWIAYLLSPLFTE